MYTECLWLNFELNFCIESLDKLPSHIATEPGIPSNAAHHRRRRRIEPLHGPYPCSVFSETNKKSNRTAKEGKNSEKPKDHDRLKKFTGRSSSGGCDSHTLVNYERTLAEFQEMLKQECIRAIEAPFRNDTCLSYSSDSETRSDAHRALTGPRNEFVQNIEEGSCRSVASSGHESRMSPSYSSGYGTYKSKYG